MLNETWREILEYLPPLIFLLILIFSPGLMRFIQKKILLHETKIKKDARETTEKVLLSEEDTLLSRENQSQTRRTVTNTPEMSYSGSGQKNNVKKSPSLEKIETLPPLQKAIVWAEILGPPGGLGSPKK